MGKTLTSDEYIRSHVSTSGNFQISFVHTNAVNKIKDPLENKRILDIGCGNGELLWLLEKKNAEVYGIDYDPKSIATAKTHLKKQDNLIIGIVTKLPYEANYFDFIFTLGTLGYLSKKDLVQATQEMFRTLRGGGKVIIRTATKKNFIGTYLLRLKHKDYVSNTNFYSTKTYLKIFREAGFTIIKMEGSSDTKVNDWWKKIIMPILEPFLKSTWIILKK